MRWTPCLLAPAFAGAFLAACSGDSAPLPPADLLDGGDNRPDAGNPPPGLTIMPSEIADGLNSDAVLGDPMELIVTPNGTLAVIYGAIPVGQGQRTIRFAERMSADTWRVETAVVPGSAAPNQGELLALSAGVWNNQVHVVYLGGDDDNTATSPFPTDLVLATQAPNGLWSEQTLVDQSGEAFGNCPDFQNTCNVGGVVGSHASLAVNTNGDWAVVYRDTHFGFALDDLRRSDVEVYRSNGSATLFDPERGGGAWADVTYLPNSNDLAVAYLVESDVSGQDVPGLWVVTDIGGVLTPTKVTDQTTTHRVSLEAQADGTLWLAWFDAGTESLSVGRSVAPYTSWTVERIDEAGSTGLHPDMKIAPSGQPYIAYAYCGPASDRNCPGGPGANAEIRLARYTGSRWQIDPIADGDGRGGVGFFTRLAILPFGELAIAYQDTRNLDVVVSIVQETQP